MDFLLFYSQYSPSSKKLLDEFPMLQEKAISVDSAPMRAYVKRIHVVCVPTLMVLMGKRVIDRVIGYESIYNWLMTSLYRMGQLQASPTVLEPEVHDESSSSFMGSSPTDHAPVMMVEPTSSAGSTSLDDLILEDVPAAQQQDRETPLVQTGMSANTMMLAEALKKERDNLDPGANKKKFSQ